MSNATPSCADHAQHWDLLPWYVNARLSDRERQRVDTHLQVCAACRAEVDLQRRIHTAMVAADPGVVELPTAGLKRLQQRLAAHDAMIAAGEEAEPHPLPSSGRRARLQGRLHGRSHGVMAASVATMAVALCVVAGVYWSQSRRGAAPSDYFTVTVATPRAANEVIRAVFSATITLSELQVVLDDARLKIVAGPTEAGVYSLAAASALTPGASESTDWSLRRLRLHSAVRFAEAIAPAAAPMR